MTPPNDTDAERGAVATALMLGSIPDELRALTGKDFYRPEHEALWSICLELVRRKSRCDADAVRARLMETGQSQHLSLLIGLAGEGIGRDPGTLAAIIADRAGLRRLIEVHMRGLQQAQSATAEYEELVRRAESELAGVSRESEIDLDTLRTLEEYLGQQDPDPDWVIDGLLARGERLMLTGVEGWGKTTLLRQLGMCAAAGMDPFTGKRQESRRVLFLDAENPDLIMRKRLRELEQAINAHGAVIPRNHFIIDTHPEGLDLWNASDRRWLERRVRMVRPDMLVIGPAYKLHEAGNEDKDETVARLVTSILDDLRTSCGFALVLEHHSGNETAGGQRPVRPYGSSLWRRWPEFGYGIRPMRTPKGWAASDVERRRLVDLVPWRGPRDVRPWPKQLESGGTGMPWVETVVEAA